MRTLRKQGKRVKYFEIAGDEGHKALGLTIPASLLQRADQGIE
ncbi:MAG TPA: hypothetical protein VL086_17490 [Candidatus Nitrosotalea sp.]|nr:hypothetical protein [Candidatus Nitrosotalea sp.]